MSTHSPTIVKLAERVLLEVESAVRGFDRYHKYAAGAELRNASRRIARCAHSAWYDKGNQATWVARLVTAVDEIKVELQLCKSLQAFRSFAQFEALARLVNELGKQCGGWHKEQQRKSQNAPTKTSMQRAQILSTRTASAEANL